MSTNDDPPAYPENPQNFDGYEKIGVCIPNPIEMNNLPEIEFKKQENIEEAPSISEDQARDALRNFVKESIFYKKEPVETMRVISMTPFNTSKYTLDTFVETRSTNYKSEPFFGVPNMMLNMMNGRPPQPWEINARPSSLFVDSIFKTEIPNSSHLEICRMCNAQGFKPCFHCKGSGRKPCFSCNGMRFKTGIDSKQEPCFSCKGNGFDSCFQCKGSGRDPCFHCKGAGRLKWYLELCVEFKTHKDEYFKHSDHVTEKNLKKCIGKSVFTETNHKLNPITNYSDSAINQASNSLINQHLSKYSSSKILAQRHEINVIPVTLVTYEYNGKQYNYIVYGLENKVNTDEYPAKGCCTII
ncbi:unnamed protein product [Brachionus calyciflorus]|uniref:SSUH2 n=1 Tax=Brachionus calyciflorus TaxID=104777 RepID=A0A813X2Q8_9BILA|nr:unnamed protein product [Brachionus calyciflorus]